VEDSYLRKRGSELESDEICIAKETEGMLSFISEIRSGRLA
jgi:hypothetical protein